MMDHADATARPKGLTIKYGGVSLIGFLIDFAMLHVLIKLGLQPAWARLISLLCAMHVTFVLNGLHVFRQLTLRNLPGQWTRYMLCNGFGNFCNYWVFVTLVSLHWAVVSAPAFALAIGSFAAWVINFAATRFIVFPHRGGARSSQVERR